MKDIEVELASLYEHVALLKKEKCEPSPGLKASIAALRRKQENFTASILLWREVHKVYPNYDR